MSNKVNTNRLKNRNTNPMQEIFMKHVALMQIRSIHVDIVANLAPEFIIEYVDDDGKITFEMDWEFALFKATNFQLGKLLEKYTLYVRSKDAKTESAE